MLGGKDHELALFGRDALGSIAEGSGERYNESELCSSGLVSDAKASQGGRMSGDSHGMFLDVSGGCIT